MLAKFPVDTINQHREKVIGSVKTVEPTGDEVMHFDDVSIDGAIGVLNDGNIERIREWAGYMVGIYHIQNGSTVRNDPSITVVIADVDNTATLYEDAPFGNDVDGLRDKIGFVVFESEKVDVFRLNDRTRITFDA